MPEIRARDRWLRRVDPLNYESLIQVLRHFDLTSLEIRVYLCLATNGPQVPSQMAKALDFHRTQMYKTCRTLEVRGLTERIYSRPIRYKALNFEEALNLLIGERERKTDELRMLHSLMAEAVGQLPRNPTDEENSYAFTFPDNAHTTLIRELAKQYAGLYYLTDEASRHLYGHIPDYVEPLNSVHLEMGSFIVLNGNLFLPMRNSGEEWRCARITVPSIVEAYRILHGFLIKQQEVPAHVN